MFDWQDLHHFLVTARTGSLTGAARELRVDHATVGRRIARLEAATGLKLIDRLARSSHLTEGGAALAAAAGPIDEVIERVRRHLRHASEPMAGTVTISALPMLAAHVIGPSLAALREQHAALKIVLSASAAVAPLDRGEVDITIGYVRPTAETRIVRRIGIMRLSLCASPAYIKRRSAEWAFIGFEEALDHIPQQHWIAKFAGERPFALRTSDVATQLEAVRAGVGIALLPSFVTERSKDLVCLTCDPEPPARELWMAVHADVRRSPAVRVVMDHLAAVIGRMDEIR